MPPLRSEEYEALKEDIRRNGVLVPVEYDEHGNILDGHHRVQACMELGITEWSSIVRVGLTEAEKRLHARRLNLARRHLTRAQKAEIIRQQLLETPHKSDRQLAAALGASHRTIAKYRAELERIGQIAQCDRETSDGRIYPSARKPPQDGDTTRASKPVAIFAAGSHLRRQAHVLVEAAKRGSGAAVKLLEAVAAGNRALPTARRMLSRLERVPGEVLSGHIRDVSHDPFNTAVFWSESHSR